MAHYDSCREDPPRSDFLGETPLTEEQVQTTLEWLRLSPAQRSKAVNVLLSRGLVEFDQNLRLVERRR